MTIEDKRLQLPIKQKVTIALLCFLLLLRLSDYFLSKAIWGDYSFYYYTLIVFPFLVAAIWLNKDDIQDLQIDKSFLFIFVLSGAFLTWIFWPSIGCLITGGGTLIIFELLRRNKFGFSNKKVRLFSIIVFSLLGLISVLLFFSLVDPSLFHFEVNILKQDTLSYYFTSRLWFAVYEEVVFRGILYMVLRRWIANDWKINLIQGILFWIAHYSYFPRLSFWITIPIVGLWYGFLALRSKSLTPGTITHFVFNMMVNISKNIM